MNFVCVLLWVLLLTPGISEYLHGDGGKCGYPQVQAILHHSSRIIGGTEAVYGFHPWLVSLKKKGLHFCGAAVLTERWILTAAHCVYRVSDSSLQNIIAVVGEHDQRVFDKGEQKFRIKTVQVHEDYQTSSPMSYDIALLEVDGDIQFGDYIQPLCLPLPSEEFLPGMTCIVVAYQLFFRKFTWTWWVQSCASTSSKHFDPTSHSLLCVQGQREAAEMHARCHSGDSGGPLLCPREDGHWVIVGITSWGKGCGRNWTNNRNKPPHKRGSPGIFTDVNMFLPWIKKKLNGQCHVSDGILTDSQGVIRNPTRLGQNYQNNDSAYFLSRFCTWSINVPTGSHILLEFLRFDVEHDDFCHSDHLAVFAGANNAIETFCGSQLPPPMLIASTSTIVQFVSDVSSSAAGFSIRYRAVADNYTHGPGCATVALFHAQGLVQSPNHPKHYGNDTDCRWVIRAPKGHVVKLDFHDFDLEQSEHCYYDSVKVMGDLYGKDEIVVLCGGGLPPPVLSYSSVMVLRFTSDSSLAGRGFRATFSFISENDLHEQDSSEGVDVTGDWVAQSRQLQTGLCGIPHVLTGSEEPLMRSSAWNVHLSLDTNVACGGVIIEETWVLTSAHCISTLNQKQLKNLKVRSGGHKVQVRGVRRVIMHPQYDPLTLDGDVALLKLNTALVFDEDTQPVCLPFDVGDFLDSQYKCTVAVQNRGESGYWNHPPQQMEVMLVGCKHYHGSGLTATMLCAELLEGSASCMEDPGLPLVCRSIDSTFFVLGVATSTEGCRKFRNPVVYSSVSTFLDWIQDKVDETN
ncbi:ovochymase-2 isoform X2 [Denticeps clupeoides]|uniref:ovochymase-2 isoform X2 n=1 Tax=Denticeps clupeoides TaxID=299321 RepID=UPI0010A34A22|nr:ovochymase-2-like isoform X2 [Denticeps clupeoides]